MGNKKNREPITELPKIEESMGDDVILESTKIEMPPVEVEAEPVTPVAETFVDTADKEITEVVIPAEDDGKVVGEIWNCKNLNIRSDPSANGSILCILPEGTKVHLLEDNHPYYYKISTMTGIQGYAVRDYVKLLNV